MAKSKYKRIIKWMKGRGIWTRFCNNCQRTWSFWRGCQGINIGVEMVKKYGDICIDAAFDWDDTPEGCIFWELHQGDMTFSNKFYVQPNLRKG